MLFIHHSVGESLIQDGGVRELLTEAGFDFWDHGYNDPKKGLHDNKGIPAGCYYIPDDNTDPDGLAAIFQEEHTADNAAIKILKSHDVIVMKSCFPVSQVQEDDPVKDLADPKRKSINNYKRHYLRLRDSFGRHPDKIFIVMTQPPLHPGMTTLQEARRARQLSEWLQSSDFISGKKNLYVFDYFGKLADRTASTLRPEYQIRVQNAESHPNSIAQLHIGPQFVDFVVNAFNTMVQRDRPEVVFDMQGWENQIIRMPEPRVSLSGRVISSRQIKRLFWSDLQGRRGDLQPGRIWRMSDIRLSSGVSRIVVTAVDEKGERSSSAIGLSYYSGNRKKSMLFDGITAPGFMKNASFVRKPGIDGQGCLEIKGNGEYQRVSVGGFDLDISDYDPLTSQLEITYDQGTDDSPAYLLIPGIGSVALDTDTGHGYQKITVPMKQFKYVQHTVTGLVIKGKWRDGTAIRIKTIAMIDSGYHKHH